jgi:hypothetical protein
LQDLVGSHRRILRAFCKSVKSHHLKSPRFLLTTTTLIPSLLPL